VLSGFLRNHLCTLLVLSHVVESKTGKEKVDHYECSNRIKNVVRPGFFNHEACFETIQGHDYVVMFTCVSSFTKIKYIRSCIIS